MSILAVDSIKPRATGVAVTVTGDLDATGTLGVVGIATVGILTSYESITINVGSGSTEVATALKAKASTGKAIAMAMVFG